MDSLERVLGRAFGAVFCIYGAKALSESLSLLRTAPPQSRQAALRGGGGLLLVPAGLLSALSPYAAAASFVAAPAIGLLVVGAVLDRRTSETIDLALLSAAFLYLATA